MRFPRLPFALFLLVTLCACATRPPEVVSGEIFYQHAGEPVSQIRYASLIAWQPAGDSAVLMRFDRQRYYLIELGEPCPFNLRFAVRLGVDTSMPGRINRFDMVTVEGDRCRIIEMRPVDYEALQEALGERWRRPSGSDPGQNHSGGT